MFSLLPLRILYFPCYFEVSLNFKLERTFFFFKKIPNIFQSIFCRMDKWNLFLSTYILLINVLIFLIHHFVLFFSILYQNEKTYVKRFLRQYSFKLHDFFCILCGMDIFLKKLIIYQSGITTKISNT